MPAATPSPLIDHRPQDDSGHPYVVGLFFISFACSYVDRQIVSILVQPLKAALSLSDTQIGLVQGFAFTICYATAGLFVAKLVDRSNRVRLSAVCVAIWSVSTVLCGTATSLAFLVLWRAGTSIAEAALSPAASSVFSDLYPPHKVSRPTSIFMLGPYLGGGIALLGGGVLLGWLNQPSVLARLAELHLEAWQVAFAVVGAPGLALAALLFLTVREPPRRASIGVVTDATPPMIEVLRELFVRNRFCLPFFAGYVLLITVFYSHSAWFPTLLIRRFGIAASTAGQYAGPVFMLGGIAGVASASFLVRKTGDAQTLVKVLRIPAMATGLLTLTALIAPLVPNFAAALGLFGLCAFSVAVTQALAPVPIQVAIPNRMRGRSIALLVFLTNALAGSIGPFAVGLFNDLNTSMKWVDNGLGVALAAVGAASALGSALFYFAAARRAELSRPVAAALAHAPEKA
jgi:MFS family permease